MDVVKVKEYIDSGLSISDIANLEKVTYSVVRHFLRANGLKSLRRNGSKAVKVNIDGTVHCSSCKKSLDSSSFYTLKSGKYSKYCITCSKIQVLNRNVEFKKQCLDICGTSCFICGYNKCTHALDFHHKDPSLKDFDISSLTSKVLNETVKCELSKCVTLCKNCHSEVHAGLVTI